MRSLALYVINVARFTSNKSPWRNWLARPTVNREVGSSSLPGDVSFCFCFFALLVTYLHSFPCSFISFGETFFFTLISVI